MGNVRGAYGDIWRAMIQHDIVHDETEHSSVWYCAHLQEQVAELQKYLHSEDWTHAGTKTRALLMVETLAAVLTEVENLEACLTEIDDEIDAVE
jgi:hypothetical protein